MRRPEWKQTNPRDQLIAVLHAAAGFANNISNGVYKPEDVPAKASRIEELLAQAQELTSMVNGEWPAVPPLKSQ